MKLTLLLSFFMTIYEANGMIGLTNIMCLTVAVLALNLLLKERRQ